MNWRYPVSIVSVLLAVGVGVGVAHLGQAPKEPAQIYSPGHVSYSQSGQDTTPDGLVSSPGSGAGENAAAPGPLYCLREYDGKIGVFIDDALQPEMVFDVYTQTLPAVDAQLLKDGIYVDDYAKLVSLIEDYIS